MNPSPHDVRKGLWLGLLGVAIFAVTLPMTRLATGTTDAPQLSPWFVTFGRATLAGALSIVFLLLTRSRWPTRHERLPLAMATLGKPVRDGCKFIPLRNEYPLLERKRIGWRSYCAIGKIER